MSDPLVEHLRTCCVHVLGESPGCGFFIAPRLVVTCSHVVGRKRQGGEEIMLEKWDQGGGFSLPVAATVWRNFPDEDIAFIQTSDPSPGYAPLGGEGARLGHQLTALGFPKEGEQYVFDQFSVAYEGQTMKAQGTALVKFKGGQVQGGFSGGPLLNLNTCRVMGVVRLTRDQRSDLGGWAVEIPVLERLLLECGQEIPKVDPHWAEAAEKQCVDAQAKKFDFKTYLQSVVDENEYLQLQNIYTPTTVEDRKQLRQRILKLRVERLKLPTEEQGEQVDQYEVLEGLRHYAADHILLIGKPGSGKSTALAWLLWQEANTALHDPDAKIPVLLKLRRCTSTIEHLIKDFLGSHRLFLDVVDIQQLLSQGRLLLLLDGLNELPEEFRAETFNFRDRYRSSTPMIVSTREQSIGGTLGITNTLKMLPLTDLQMQEFVRGYLSSEGDHLYRLLEGSRLQHFAETPLLLWMLCRVFAENGKVPTNLGLAFREFAKLYDKGTEEQQAIQADAQVDSRHYWPKLLRYLAYAMIHDKESVEFRLSIPREEAENLLAACLQHDGKANARDCAERWLNDLLAYHLIQLVIKPNHEEEIEFSHQLIQEYYAAEALLKQLPRLNDVMLQRDYLNYLKWSEPVALMLALLDDERSALHVVEQSLAVDHLLGARMAGEVSNKFQAKTVVYVDRVAVPEWLKVKLLDTMRSAEAIPGLLRGLNNADWQVRSSAADALGKIGSDYAIPGLLQVLGSSEFAVSMSAVDAFGEIGSAEAITSLFQRLDDASVHDKADYALAKIGSADVIHGLCQRLFDANSAVRLRAVHVLGLIGSPEAIPGLLQGMADPDANVRGKAAYALCEISSPKTLPGMLKCSNDPDRDVRQKVVVALGRIGCDAAIPGLLQRLDDADKYVRSTAFEALGKISSPKAVSRLLQCLDHPDADVRSEAVSVLAEIGSAEAIPELLQRLEDSEGHVRNIAAYALSKIDSPEVIPGLLKWLKHADNDVRSYVVFSLSQIGSAEVIPGLLQGLVDPDASVRCSAVEALGDIGSDEVIPGLLQRLDDPDTAVRTSTVDALGKIGSSIAIPGLLQCLEHSDDGVRKNAFEALGKIASPEATAKLLQCLENADAEVRTSAVETLSKIRSHEAIPSLLNLLDDMSFYVRMEACDALSHIGSADAISGLLHRLEDSDADVRMRAVIALGKIGSAEATPGLLRRLDDIDADVRSHAVDALGQIGSAEAIPGLLQRMHDPFDYVRMQAFEALAQIGSAEALSGLLQRLEDPDAEVRIRAVDALGKIGSPQAVPGLLQRLNDVNFQVRIHAVYWLGQIGSAKSIPGLLQLLDGPDAHLRRVAVEAMREIGSAEAFPGLIQGLDDVDAYVRHEAALSLKEIAKRNGNDLATHLPRLLTLIPTHFGRDALNIILDIQATCKFYNYSYQH